MTDRKKNSSVFDRITAEFINAGTAEQMLSDCMSLKPHKMTRVPLRYRIIALCFARGDNLEDLNALLLQEGCPQLYARSYLESSLIFAFKNRLSYGEWKSLCLKCETIRASSGSEHSFFPDKKISFQELEQYVLVGSDPEAARLKTRQMTRILEQNILSLGKDHADFQQFFVSNLYVFSEVREKTRYYFCKYLYMYIREKIDDFVAIARKRKLTAADYLQLITLKGITPLKRKKMSPEEIRQFLGGCDISCGEIFSEFNYFYFQYVSSDWTQILIEYLEDPEELTDEQAQSLTAALRQQHPSRSSLSDEELLSWAFDGGLDDEADGEVNRLGETTIRKYIKGTLDIDRTTLICFLLFFGHHIRENDYAITHSRLDTILQECGFSPLDKADAFDDFVLRFLRAKDPAECLMDEVTAYAIDGENFYLYHLFWSAQSQSALFRKLMGL